MSSNAIHTGVFSVHMKCMSTVSVSVSSSRFVMTFSIVAKRGIDPLTPPSSQKSPPAKKVGLKGGGGSRRGGGGQRIRKSQSKEEKRGKEEAFCPRRVGLGGRRGRDGRKVTGRHRWRCIRGTEQVSSPSDSQKRGKYTPPFHNLFPHNGAKVLLYISFGDCASVNAKLLLPLQTDSDYEGGGGGGGGGPASPFFFPPLLLSFISVFFSRASL